MSSRPAAFALPTRIGIRGRPILALAAIFAALPIVAGLVYRTYAPNVSPHWLEGTRHLGFLFVLAELAVILRAHDLGLRFQPYWQATGGYVRAALLLFLATFWVSSVFVSLYPGFSTFLTLTWIVHIAFAAAVHFLVGRMDRREVMLFAFVLLGGLALFLPMIAVHFVFHPPPESVPGGVLDWGTAIPGFISVRLFGAYAGGLVALALGLVWACDPRGRLAWWAYAALTLALAAVIWSGTRAALPGIAVAVLAGLLTVAKRPSRRFFLLVPLCCVVATVLVQPLIPEGDPRFMLFGRFLNHHGQYASLDAASSLRLEMWTQALRAWLDVPLFGAGSESSYWLTEIGGEHHVQPHNVVVQFLLSWGAPATVAGLFLLGAATLSAHRAVRRSWWLLPILLMLDCLLTISLLDGTLYFPRFVMLIMACYAMCLAGSVGPAGADDGRGA